MLGRDLVMVPKLIHPLPPQTPRSPKLQNGGDDIEEEPPTPHPVNDTWMQVSLNLPSSPACPCHLSVVVPSQSYPWIVVIICFFWHIRAHDICLVHRRQEAISAVGK